MAAPREWAEGGAGARIVAHLKDCRAEHVRVSRAKVLDLAAEVAALDDAPSLVWILRKYEPKRGSLRLVTAAVQANAVTAVRALFYTYRVDASSIALHLLAEVACPHNFYQIARLLLKRYDTKVGAWAQAKRCAARLAAARDHTFLLAALINATPELRKNANGLLIMAAPHASLPMLHLLVNEHGADARANDSEALRRAAKSGSLVGVRFLRESGARATALSSLALRLAAGGGHDAVVAFLVGVEVMSDVHAAGDEALRRAACGGHASTMALLVEHGADPLAVFCPLGDAGSGDDEDDEDDENNEIPIAAAARLGAWDGVVAVLRALQRTGHEMTPAETGCLSGIVPLAVAAPHGDALAAIARLDVCAATPDVVRTARRLQPRRRPLSCLRWVKVCLFHNSFGGPGNTCSKCGGHKPHT